MSRGITRTWYRFQNNCSVDRETIISNDDDYDRKILYKANILQYRKNSHVMTKAQKYAYLAKKIGRNLKTCTVSHRQYTSSHNSDIPGKEIMLYWDNRIATYNNNIKRIMTTNSTPIDRSKLFKLICYKPLIS